MNIHPKIIAGGSAAGLTSPLAVVIVWTLAQFHVTMTPEVAAAFAALLSAGLGALAAYLTPSPKVGP